MSHRALSAQQFQFKPAEPKGMPARPHHELYAFGEMGSTYGHTGTMQWHHKTGEIGNIEVRPEARRQGVATALLGHARDIAADTRGVRAPRHSADRTTAGEAWARSLGERLPKLRK